MYWHLIMYCMLVGMYMCEVWTSRVYTVHMYIRTYVLYVVSTYVLYVLCVLYVLYILCTVCTVCTVCPACTVCTACTVSIVYEHMYSLRTYANPGLFQCMYWTLTTPTMYVFCHIQWFHLGAAHWC